MKYLKPLAIILTLMIMLVSNISDIAADTSVNVIVTARPLWMTAPTNFDAEEITQHKVTITWTKDPLAVNTLVRGKIGSYPTGTGDGYLVYFGGLETVDDDSVSLDETAAQVYYRAWSEDGAGGYSTDWVQDLVGGVGVTLIAFIFLAVGLLILASFKRDMMFWFMAGGGWIILGFYSWTQSTGNALYWGLAVFAIIVGVILSVYAPYEKKGIEDAETTPRVKIVAGRSQAETNYENFLARIQKMKGNPMRRGVKKPKKNYDVW